MNFLQSKRNAPPKKARNRALSLAEAASPEAVLFGFVIGNQPPTDPPREHQSVSKVIIACFYVNCRPFSNSCQEGR